MKNFVYILILFSTIIYGQAGTGNNLHTASILHVPGNSHGILLPQVQLVSRGSSTPLPSNTVEGVVVFNKALSTTDSYLETGYYIWDGSKWNNFSDYNQKNAIAAQFQWDSSHNNQNITSNSTTNSINVQIFQQQIFNDDPSVFQKVNNTQLRVTKAGLYMITVSLGLILSELESDSRVSNYIYVTRNNNLASGKLVTNVPQLDPDQVDAGGKFSFQINLYVNLDANDILRLNSINYKTGPNYNIPVNFDSTTKSTFTIVEVINN
jgi:hypothetical protein